MEGIDKSTFKRIFQEHWAGFKVAYPRFESPDYNSVVQKMLDCGDPDKMGYVQYRCLACGDTRRIAFTCKSCFCLSCAAAYSDHWAEFIARRLFPGATYRHIVLTMPDFLHGWFDRDPTLLSRLMQTGYACLDDILRTSTGVALDIGAIIVLQTCGRSGHYHPHLHILLTAGGLDPRGQWKSVGFIPYDIMHQKWQYHLLNLLRHHVADPTVAHDIDRAWRSYPKGFVAYLQPGNVPPGAQGLAQYLAKYVVSPAISLRRIEQYDGQSVRYWYHDHETQAVQQQTLPVLQFIGRMVQHIVPKGFQRIRYYGLHGNVRYEKMRQQLAEVLTARSPSHRQGYRVLRRRPFTERLRLRFGQHPLLCPRCRNVMERELIQHADYGIIQDDGLELYRAEPLHEQLESRTQCLPGVAAREAPGDALGRATCLGQLPLPLL